MSGNLHIMAIVVPPGIFDLSSARNPYILTSPVLLILTTAVSPAILFFLRLSDATYMSRWLPSNRRWLPTSQRRLPMVAACKAQQAHTHTRSRDENHKQEQSKKSGERELLRSRGAALDVFRSVGTAQCAALVSADAMQYRVSRILPDPYCCSYTVKCHWILSNRPREYPRRRSCLVLSQGRQNLY